MLLLLKLGPSPFTVLSATNISRNDAMSKDTLSMFTHPSQTESSSAEPALAALLRQVIGTDIVKHAEVRESSDEEDASAARAIRKQLE